MSEDLHEAIRSHDLAAVAQVLRRSPAAVREKDTHGRTPLTHAATEFPEAIALLLDVMGIKSSAELSDALRCAVDVKHQKADQAPAFLDAVRLLLSAGADPSRANGRGETALHSVAEGSALSPGTMEEIVALLIDHGADIQRRNDLGWTPLDMAYISGNAPAARRLRAAGARFALQIEDPANAAGAELGVAALAGDIDELSRLLALPGADIEARDLRGCTALHSAAASGDTAVVRFLLAQGADPMARANERTPQGKLYLRTGHTPLHTAAHAGYPDVIRLLLDAVADVNAPWGRHYRGDTPLMMATVGAIFNQRSKEEAHKSMRLLIERGADVRARLWAHLTEPEREALADDEESEEDAEEEPSYPETALMFAAWIGYPAEIRILLDAGAVGEREDLLEAVHATIPHGYRNLPTLWDAGRRLLDPPLTLAEAVPYLDGPGLRSLLENTPNIDVNEPDPATGEAALARALQRVGKRRDPWREDRSVYEQDTVELMRHYGE